MIKFFEAHPNEVFASLIVLGILAVIHIILSIIIRRVAKKNNKNYARVKLVGRYVSVILTLIAILVESYIFGVNLEQIAIVFSSVFAVIGIGLFAVWSILSNVTSGVIMFFSFPFKIGDKIHIHDKDYEIIGIIEDIRSFQTHIKKDNGQLVTCPNNIMLQKAVSIVEKNAFDK
jgi:small-conductance mechanosensitive channel